MSWIITATDFSAHADRAFLRSLLLARQTGARLLFAHAIGDGHDPVVRAERLAAAEQRLRALCASATDTHGMDAGWAVLDGTPDEELPRLASERGARLLVLGPHDPEPIRDLLFGRMARKLLSRLPCPLLFANGLAATPYRQVLIATDLSSGAADAVATAADLLQGQDATALLYHAFEPRPFGGMAASAVSRAAAEQERSQHRAQLEQELAELAAATGLAGATVLAEPANGPAATMILRCAETVSADLVVAGTQGKSATERLILGSVAEELLREAPQDLLLVPSR